MKPRVAFVVQRYGLEVTGGAELECRSIAELMTDMWDVTVLTTCALDYYTWSNHYPAGEEIINSVTVHRFPVKKKRNVKKFNKISGGIFGKPHSQEDELRWMAAQGPDAPQLVDTIKEQQDQFDVFIFFTYLYGTTFWGLPCVAHKSLLVPTAHDEPPIYLSIFEDLFSKPKGFIFNSPEEKAFLKRKFDIDTSLSDVIGVGVQVNPNFNHVNSYANNLPDNYVIYVGRIDGSKGCPEMFDYWEQYKDRHKDDLRLSLVGRQQMEIPRRKDIVPLGYLSEQEKLVAIARAQCLIMPSPFESLSIVLLEAWLCGRPVLVNGKCKVLKGQCRRSNGGLWYENFDEFEACLNFFLNEKETALKMAVNGKRFVELNYSWTEIKKKYIALIDRLLND
jgi:glycosyltransferase involved in cell wall biosynthesis